MIKQISLLAVLSALAISPYALAESREEAEALCKEYAVEDKVPAQELEKYLAECIKDLTEESMQEQK
ncbi:MAG: hypothetical protein ABW072_18625 [Sedimenticola sp.]